EDGTGLAQPDLGDQELEAVAARRGGAGAPLVLIDDGDGRLGPAEILGPLHEVVLAGGAGGGVPGPGEGGLAEGWGRAGGKVVGANLGIAACNGHDRSPWLLTGRAGGTGRTRVERADGRPAAAGRRAGRARCAAG